MLIRISTNSAWKIMKLYSRKMPCDFKVRCHTSEQNFMHAPGPDELYSLRDGKNPLSFVDPMMQALICACIQRKSGCDSN